MKLCFRVSLFGNAFFLSLKFLLAYSNSCFLAWSISFSFFLFSVVYLSLAQYLQIAMMRITNVMILYGHEMFGSKNSGRNWVVDVCWRKDQFLLHAAFVHFVSLT